MWGHSYEFENNNNWVILKNFCKTAGGREDIWYATNIEICDYISAFGLKYDDDTGLQIFSVNPGQTIDFL